MRQIAVRPPWVAPLYDHRMTMCVLVQSTLFVGRRIIGFMLFLTLRTDGTKSCFGASASDTKSVFLQELEGFISIARAAHLLPSIESARRLSPLSIFLNLTGFAPSLADSLYFFFRRYF